MTGEIYVSCPDLQDQAIQNSELTLFSDGSSYLQEGIRKAVTTATEVLVAKALPAGWLAQRLKLHALIQSLTISEGQRVNIYTDSPYAFTTVHIHGAICKERGLLIAAEKAVKNKEEILKFLEAV